MDHLSAPSHKHLSSQLLVLVLVLHQHLHNKHLHNKHRHLHNGSQRPPYQANKHLLNKPLQVA